MKNSAVCIVFLLLLILILSIICAVLGVYLWRNQQKLETNQTKVVIPAHQEQYHREMVDQINRNGNSWIAVYNKFASEWISDQLEKHWEKEGESKMADLLKFSKNWVEIARMTNDHMKEILAAATPIPREFDSRLHWPNCASVHRIPNQGACGSCWAVAASTVITDRICIHSNGTKQLEISIEDVVSCSKPSAGCGGGWGYVAFWTWKERGFVTGGPYGSNEGCRPYTAPNDCGAPCHWYHWIHAETPKCVENCQSIYQKNYDEDRNYGSVVYAPSFQKLHPGDAEPYNGTIREFIQREIQAYGPIEACFNVYEDFQHYHSGVYTYVTGNYLYPHCVRLLGWGETQNKVPYWIAVNSFGRNWGQNGIFWLHRNYTLISVVAGLP